MKSRGFTLVELLVSTAVVLLVVGAIAALALPMRRGFDRGLAGSDIAARGRTAIAAIVADARDAASGVVIGPDATSLGDVMPAIVPSRSLDDRRLLAPFFAVTIARAVGPQGLLRDRVEAGSMTVRLNTAAACTEQDATCNLRRGDTVAIFDSARVELVALAGIDPGTATVQLTAPLTGAFDSGAVLAAVERTAYGLRERPDGTTRLVRVTSGGAEQPIVDRVSAFEVATDVGSADLIGARRLDVSLRLGSSVPDGAALELRTSIALRK